MLVMLGWMLLAGLPPERTITDHDLHSTAANPAEARVTVWTDRDEPYARGESADVYLSVEEPSYVAVFRVDTDGRIRVLFPREPWTDTYVRGGRELEVAGPRGGRSFLIDDDPGMGYLFAVASTEPLDFGSITRGDYWDYRLIDGGRIQGDPYVRLTDLAARLVPHGDYDYDVAPYYVDQRYAYPRFVCYDCHAYASYRDWNPYRSPCTRYRVVIRDDPRYYPYHWGGRNVVATRPAHPGPRYLFRDADSSRPAVGQAELDRRPGEQEDLSRTSEDVGGRGAIPAPRVQSFRTRDREVAPEPWPARPLADERRRADSRRDADSQQPRRADDTTRELPDGLRHPKPAPRSTGEPELRRRRP
jgi:Domain of unknown function (DUF4384)